MYRTDINNILRYSSKVLVLGHVRNGNGVVFSLRHPLCEYSLRINLPVFLFIQWIKLLFHHLYRPTLHSTHSEGNGCGRWNITFEMPGGWIPNRGNSLGTRYVSHIRYIFTEYFVSPDPNRIDSHHSLHKNVNIYKSHCQFFFKWIPLKRGCIRSAFPCVDFG